MWTKADDLRLSVLMGLRKGLKLCRGMRRALTEDERNSRSPVRLSSTWSGAMAYRQRADAGGALAVDGEVMAIAGW